LISARASGDLDVVRRVFAGAVFRAALRVVWVAFFMARFADPFVVRVALFAVLRTRLRVRLPAFRVLRATLSVVRVALFAVLRTCLRVRLPVFRASRAALFFVVLAFFAGMSCSSLICCDPTQVPEITVGETTGCHR